jgi:hypothetical protein
VSRSRQPWTERWASVWPWLAGLIGGAIFLRPLWRGPGTFILDRVFWYDTLVNIDDLAELHGSFSTGMAGRNFWDWLYGGHFFFPQPRPLITSELMPLAGLVSWPLAGRPLLAHNALLAVAVVLNCVAGASFARTLGARALAATIAGTAFAFSGYTNFVSARVQLLFLFPIAWSLAAGIRWARSGSWRDAFVTALWALAQAMLCLYYAVYLAIALPLVVGIARLCDRRPGLWRDVFRLGVAFAAVLPWAALLLWPYRELRTALGLAHSYASVVEQSGNLQMFLWADASTLLGSLLVDAYKWDTAYFPGVVVCLGVLLAGALWLRGNLRSHGMLMLVALVGLGFVLLFPVALAIWGAVLVMLIRRARRGEGSPMVPVLLTLGLSGLLLFAGPEPKILGRDLSWSPYEWLYRHAPFFDGLRMARRAALLTQLALCGAAALALSRLEVGRRGIGLLGCLALFTLIEGMPLRLQARSVPNSCEDEAMRVAASQGVTAIGDFSREWLGHPAASERRHQGTLCKVAVTQGFGGFWPTLADLATDAVMSLPDRAAYLWLWKAGVHDVVLRAGPYAWHEETRKRLAPIAASTQTAGVDLLMKLRPPGNDPFEPAARLDGPRVPVRAAECNAGKDCPALIDRQEDSRWTSAHVMTGSEQIVLRFAESTVAGIEWHATGSPTDLPRALRVERETTPGVWVLWRDIASLSPLRLGRDAAHPVMAIPLPPMRTSAVRVTQTGRSFKYWLSASEIEIVGAP